MNKRDGKKEREREREREKKEEEQIVITGTEGCERDELINESGWQ